MWKHLKRLIKPIGVIVMTASQPFTSSLVMSNPKWFKYDWVWQKPKGTGHLNAKKQPMRNKEDILVFYQKQCTYNPQFASGKPYKARGGTPSDKDDCYGEHTSQRNNNTGYRYPSQILYYPIVERNRLHPTQKPVELMEYLIRTYTNVGDTVLDFAMGSGTTGVACMNLNRKFIGIESDEIYFNIAKERIQSL